VSNCRRRSGARLGKEGKFVTKEEDVEGPTLVGLFF
jgi:hypothetical protein